MAIKEVSLDRIPAQDSVLVINKSGISFSAKFVKKEKLIFQKDEWHILQNVHRWYWAEKDTRKVTFDIMHKMALSDMNIRSFHRLLKKNN
jgi:hypothetical protein